MALPSEYEQKVKALLESALKLGPDERNSFLNRACAGDAKLRQGVESALAACAERPSGYQNPSSGESQTAGEGVIGIGEFIGYYK
ncbi:MAG TPA: hypothetical protein VLR92_12250, partial [Blastocatellia bacterium]|nr:hypothetical protein [Blastocatellia bacterium]